jgi:hypothetical protein
MMTTTRAIALVLGSFGLLVAAAAACALFGLALTGRPDRDGGKTLGAAMFGLGLLGGLLVAYVSALAAGGLPGIAGSVTPAPLRWALVLGAVVSAAVVATMCATLRSESPGEVPWVLLPLRAWAHWIWLPGLIAGAALGLYPGLRDALPPRAWQLPMQGLGALSLLLAAGMLAQLAWSISENQAQRAQAELDFHARRDASILQQVQAADAQRDFLSLLPQSSRNEVPEIRALALAKLRSHPDLDGALAAVLRGPFADEAFTFLESNEPVNARALAPVVREGIVAHARALREQMAGTHTLRADDYQYPVLRILAVAERYGSYGVDYRPALRQVRDAYDTPRDYAQPTPKMNGQRAVDEWLRRH